MAETNPPALDAGAASGEVAATSKKKSKKTLLLIPLLLVPAAGGAWAALNQYPSLSRVAEAVGLASGPEEEGPQPIKYGLFTQIQGVIINPAGSEGRRYLMVNVGLETAEAGVVEEIEEKEVVVRDVIIKRLGERTVEELADITLRNVIKEELRDTVNAVLRKGEVDRMYFPQYVLQ